jgi:hypothetical protein
MDDAHHPIAAARHLGLDRLRKSPRIKEGTSRIAHGLKHRNV